MESRTMVGNGAPPPPSEVKVRTMKSDLASMAKSGGGMPSFQNVEVNNLSIEKEYTTPSHAVNMAAPVVASTQPTVAAAQSIAMPAQPAPVTQPVAVAQPTISPQAITPAQQPVTQPAPAILQSSPRKDFYPIFIVAVVAILAIGGVGYFAYITFFAGTPSATTTTPTQTASLPGGLTTATVPTSTATSTASSSGSALAPTQAPITPVNPAPSQTATLTTSDELSSAHVSLFIKPADQVITVDLSAINASAYRKTMLNSLATASVASSMIEISPKAGDGMSVNIQGLLSVAGTSILTSQALASFNPDATFFVYRDKLGLWPGYILALNAGQTSSSVMGAVQQMELSTSIGNLFLTTPGTASSDGFTDSTTASIPTRVLPFSGVSFPLYFSYGWDGRYLILSTSNNGFAAAVAGLQ